MSHHHPLLHSALLMLLLQVTSNGFAQFGQFLNVKTASNYAVSGWFRVTAAASSTTMVNVRVGLQGAFFPFTLWGTTPQTALTTGSLWRQVTLTSEKGR